ncbi:hypothetical protein PAHAL_5G484300 [Panicum hallii]|uniref:Uncharacterized protein n=1 Tax=Panicum hallii TaxID=206008 RepID=A0A2S3HY02_9POAL|nr:hypothetical protein PAHAL_5G484300 [Panicum hallii]
MAGVLMPVEAKISPHLPHRVLHQVIFDVAIICFSVFQHVNSDAALAFCFNVAQVSLRMGITLFIYMLQPASLDVVLMCLQKTVGNK